MQASLPDDYLATFLAPLTPYLDDPLVTDLFVNDRGAIWVERLGEPAQRHEMALLTEDWLWHLARQIARLSAQAISRSQPLLSASLPDGTRLQIVAPPTTRRGFALAFRRQVTQGFGLADLRKTDLFDGASFGRQPNPDGDLQCLYAAGDAFGFLQEAVARRKTIVVSGGTASGKTTLVNALLAEVPRRERIVAIEDTAELDLVQPNSVGLIAARSRASESEAGAEDLLQASLRLRPDRIVLGELRGHEALTFLRAVNSGHPGSMTTIHADSPEGALDQLILLAMQAGTALSFDALRHYVDRAVDIVVQIERTPQGRRVSRIEWSGAPAKAQE